MNTQEDRRICWVERCPNEILFAIAQQVDCLNDLSSLTKLSHHWHWLLHAELFVRKFEERLEIPYYNHASLANDALFHAVKCDAVNIIRSFTSSRVGAYFRGYMVERQYIRRKVTYFHHALAADAPKMALQIAANGANTSQEMVDFYPDLTSLYLTLARPLVAGQEELDQALFTACNHGFARTAHLLLTRGANPNAVEMYGHMPIHATLTERRAWLQQSFRFSHCINARLQHTSWDRMLQSTVAALLKFGCDINLRAATEQRHSCDYRCFTSVDCDHAGQTPLHMAARAGLDDMVKYLLEQGADIDAENGQGYTALYSAISHNHRSTVDILLDQYTDNMNPVVCVPTMSTALHVCSRFAWSSMVNALLFAGADPNVADARGKTPMHEALCQTLPQYEWYASMVLESLALAGGDPDFVGSALQRPWELARLHPFLRVREIFIDRTLHSFLRQEEEKEKEREKEEEEEEQEKEKAKRGEAKALRDELGNHFAQPRWYFEGLHEERLRKGKSRNSRRRRAIRRRLDVELAENAAQAAQDAAWLVLPPIGSYSEAAVPSSPSPTQQYWNQAASSALTLTRAPALPVIVEEEIQKKKEVDSC